MRLIDAEKCPCKTCGISYCRENCNKYYEWLNGCAYDVEEVIKELTKSLDKLLHICDLEDVEKVYDFYGKMEQIVRKGGVVE